MLCDVFENFVSVCLKDYGLDPSHYISSPSLSRDAMLKFTGIQLEKINDIDVHLFLEKGKEAASLIFLKDILELMETKPSCIGMQIVYTIGP